MREVFYIEEVEQARTLLSPRRIELLRRLDEPRTCPELGEFFGETPQKIYYHVKALERAGLVEKVAERRVRGVVEGSYQAVARSYWLAPQLVGQLGDRRAARDGASLANLLALAAEVQDDVGRLARRAGRETPSLGLAAQIQLPDGERRAAFLRDVQRLVTDLARTYGATGEAAEADAGETFRLVIACYPRDDTPPTGEG
jgi:DNA-binding transcriptional ArsR family regulator